MSSMSSIIHPEAPSRAAELSAVPNNKLIVAGKLFVVAAVIAGLVTASVFVGFAAMSLTMAAIASKGAFGACVAAGTVWGVSAGLAIGGLFGGIRSIFEFNMYKTTGKDGTDIIKYLAFNTLLVPVIGAGAGAFTGSLTGINVGIIAITIKALA